MTRWRKCSVVGCIRPVSGGGNGMCDAHYRRWKHNGDPQANIPIKHYATIRDKNERRKSNNY